MTWGKAILEWSTDHREAMKRIIDLNHRYALDGRDPASYGGILWCLGQFDRPFYPEQPIFGSVRPRPLADHAARTNLEAFVKKVDRVLYQPAPRIAMIGTGLAGIVCCRILNNHGLKTKSFEKSNRAGGRLSTRVADAVMQFDHGAQYFTVRDPVLAPYLDSWRSDGCVDVWDGRIIAIDEPGLFGQVPSTQRYVGTPKMESLAEHLSSELTIEADTEVARVEPTTNGYKLSAKDGRELGEFDVVLWNCPPRQVEKMVPSQCEWFEELKKVEMVPCWAVMVALESRWDVPFDGAFVNCGALGWIARNSSKPSRSKALDTWVLHSSVAWAKENLEATKDRVASLLIGEAGRAVSSKMPRQIVAKAHRWLYSKPDESLPCEFLWDEKNRLGACGDWCGGPRIEGALKSGMALAGRFLGSLHEQNSANAVDNTTSTETIQLKLF
jgi:predicted NAD/FAD-dependent oxidoreductase